MTSDPLSTVAIGCLLTITEDYAHVGQLRRWGFLMGKLNPEAKMINLLDRDDPTLQTGW
jgi:hypothetical protein